LQLSTRRIKLRMKFARLERLTGFTQLKWPTICSLMEAWAPLFEQGSGTCRRHHAARCSFGFCFKNRIWTADRLLRREWMNDYFCPLCIRNREALVRRVPCCPPALGGDQQLDIPSKTSPAHLGYQKRNCGLV
jgi:hypothetical protein